MATHSHSVNFFNIDTFYVLKEPLEWSEAFMVTISIRILSASFLKSWFENGHSRGMNSSRNGVITVEKIFSESEF